MHARRPDLAHGPRVGVTAPRLAKVDAFFDRHGGKAILIGRFVGIVRAVAPFTAGASKLPLRGFLPWSLAGTAIWVIAKIPAKPASVTATRRPDGLWLCASGRRSDAPM